MDPATRVAQSSQWMVCIENERDETIGWTEDITSRVQELFNTLARKGQLQCVEYGRGKYSMTITKLPDPVQADAVYRIVCGKQEERLITDGSTPKEAPLLARLHLCLKVSNDIGVLTRMLELCFTGAAVQNELRFPQPKSSRVDANGNELPWHVRRSRV